MLWAKVTTSEGATIKPVLVHDDGAGLRFYASRSGRVYLLAAAPGLRIISFGEKVPGNPRERKPVAFRGYLPDPIASIERLETCGCGSPLKRFVPPMTWEQSLETR